MPKILICIESIGYGGLGTYTFSLIRHYTDLGWDIGLAATHGPGEYYEDISGRIASSIDVSKCGNLITKLKRLTEFTVEFNPDILLLNNCSLAHYMLPVLGSNIKPVAVLHSNAPFIYRAASLFRERIFRWIAPTQALHEAFLSYIPNDLHGRVRTIQHGIDPNQFVYRERHDSPRKITTIGFLGYNKGTDLLPEIYERIYRSNKRVEFFVVGDGPSADVLKEYTNNLQLPVSFTGHVHPDTIPEILAGSDILLLPTRVEGFGLVIAEAMMCGVVPVVTRLPGVTDTIVSDHTSGLLVPVDDVDGYAEAVLLLLSQGDLFKSMSKTGRDDSVRKFSLDAMMNLYSALFEEADDRGVKPVCNRLVWGWETFGTLLTKEPDGSIPLIRCLVNLIGAIRNKLGGA